VSFGSMVRRMLRYVGKVKTIVFEATKDAKIDHDEC
jgi:hypothetical protein